MSQKPSIPNSLNEHWMPFTSNKDFKERPRLITEAKGVYLKNHEGNTQIDASSGFFVILWSWSTRNYRCNIKSIKNFRLCSTVSTRFWWIF